MAGLVGDLGGEEDPLLLGGTGPHDRPQLVGDTLLADEEGREPVHALEPLLGHNPLVPVDPVLAEVEVLGRPLLALPELVELPVGQELRLAAVRGFLKRRIRGLEEALLRGDRAQRLGGPGLGGLSLGARFHCDLLSLPVRGKPTPWTGQSAKFSKAPGNRHKSALANGIIEPNRYRLRPRIGRKGGYWMAGRTRDTQGSDAQGRAYAAGLVRYDAERHRVWVCGQRLHHGLTGALLTV